MFVNVQSKLKGIISGRLSRSGLSAQNVTQLRTHTISADNEVALEDLSGRYGNTGAVNVGFDYLRAQTNGDTELFDFANETLMEVCSVLVFPLLGPNPLFSITEPLTTVHVGAPYFFWMTSGSIATSLRTAPSFHLSTRETRE